PYTYLWSTGETTPEIVPSQSGTYCVTVTFGNNCVASSCFEYDLNNYCNVWVNTIQNGLCLQASGWGTGALSYTWDNGQTGNSICPTESGLYCVTLMDALGCNATSCYWFGDTLGCDVFIIADSTAAGGSGLLAITTGTSPYSYSWSTGETSDFIIPQSSGTYCVTIVDANGCSASACYTYISNSNSYYNISGYVYLSDSTNISQLSGTAFLIEYDTVGGGTLNLVDSVSLQYAPQGTMYDFGNVAAGSYLVKVALDENSPGYADNLPTYHLSALFWDEADPITVPYNAPNWFNVWMIGGDNPGGPGFIGGLVVEGANFAGFADTRDGEGDPVANVLIILLDATDNPVTYTYTDVEGNYAFPDLAWGTYQVVVEIPGFEQAIYEVTISPTVSSIDNIIFAVDEDSVALLDATNVEEVVELATFALFPNPVSDRLTIQMEVKTHNEVQIELRSIDGQLKWQQKQSLAVGVQEVYLDMGSMPAGLYMLSIVHDGDQLSRKVLKQ
ncbi:MAG: T9SS type A sorting domain-containing protein, partial [Bacteroidota bacterium]